MFLAQYRDPEFTEALLGRGRFNVRCMYSKALGASFPCVSVSLIAT